MSVVSVFRRVVDDAGRDFMWEKTVYENALVREINGGSADGKESFQKKSMVVRIFGKCEVLPEVGDMVIAGTVEEDTPPPRAGIIRTVADNRRGSKKVRHIKITTEQEIGI